MFNTKLSKLGFILAAGALPAVNAAAGIFVFADDACPVDLGALEMHAIMENGIMTDRHTAVETGVALEFAYGAFENLELAASLDFGNDYMSGHYARKSGETRRNDFNFTGVSVGAKYQLLSPETEVLGVALVAGGSYVWAGSDQSAAREFAGSVGVNFEKDFLGGDLIVVATPGVEVVRAKDYEENYWGTEETYSCAFAASYALVEGFRLGVESFYEYTADSRTYLDKAFYMGPSMAVEGENWLFAMAAAVRTFSTDDTGSHDVVVAGQFEYVF